MSQVVCSRMRVCHFIDSSVKGDYFRNLSTGLTRNGTEVFLLDLGRSDPPKWVSGIPQVRYSSLGITSKLLYPLAIPRLAAFLKKERIDILQTHLFYAGLIGVFSKLLFPGRSTVALMRHHTGVVRMLGSRFHIAADKWMAERADHLLTVSCAARRYMREADGIKRDDIEVVYLGINFNKFAPDKDQRRCVRAEFGFSDDEFVIGYVGGIVPGKGHVQLIKAFESVLVKIPNARLFLVGSGILPEVAAAAEPFSGKVVFAGWRDDVPASINAMDLFVQPSLSEAFSQVLIEAMGCAVPVVATDVGGAGEVIDDGVNGILIPPDDVDAIIREVVALYRDREYRHSISDAGLLSVHERFGVEQMVDRHTELYERWVR
jgi:glycosyltransferase involved in cell wall biosynthesis